MDKEVRESIDGEREIFEDLLNRILVDFNEDRISWIRFVGFFSRRGKLEGYFDINMSPGKKLGASK